jgi:hypothetical protein
VLGFGLGLSREQFGGLYAEAYCELHAADEDRPAASACGNP